MAEGPARIAAGLALFFIGLAQLPEGSAQAAERPAQVVVGLAQFAAPLAQIVVGLAQSIVGLAQSIVGLAQSIIVPAQRTVGLAQLVTLLALFNARPARFADGFARISALPVRFADRACRPGARGGSLLLRLPGALRQPLRAQHFFIDRDVLLRRPALDRLVATQIESGVFERLSDRARRAMAFANGEAQRFNHEYIGTEHILLGLLKEGSGVGPTALKNLDIDLGAVRARVETLIPRGPDSRIMGAVPQTPRAKKVIEYAIEEARGLNHSYVGTEHLLLGLLREGYGVAAQVLQGFFGLTVESARDEVVKVVEQQSRDPDDALGPADPLHLPQRLSFIALPDKPWMAYLTGDRGDAISPAMRVELINEIVKRYNAH